LPVFTAACAIIYLTGGRNVFDKPNEQSRASATLPCRENDGRKANMSAKGKQQTVFSAAQKVFCIGKELARRGGHPAKIDTA